MLKSLLVSTLLLNLSFAVTGQCNVTLDPSTVKVTQDSTIATNIGAIQHYLLCPGVTLTYQGTQSAEVTYYLEADSKVISQRSHEAILYMKQNSAIDANSSGTNTWAQTNEVWHHPSATFEDDFETNPYNECADVVFNYGSVGSCGTASLDEVSQKELLKIHPNPASNQVVVETGYEFKKTISILSVLGKEVKTIESESPSTKISISELKAGTYFVKISDHSGNQLTRKLIIKN